MKGNQLFRRVIHKVCRFAYINLYDFLSRKIVTAVFDTQRELYLLSHLFGTQKRNLKIGIGEAKSEGIPNSFSKGIEVTISYIETFFIIRITDISIQTCILVIERNVRIVFRPSGGKLSRWSNFSRNNARNGITPCATGHSHE